MGIAFQVTAICYMFPYSIGSATSIRVSNALGAGRPRAAHLSARMSLDLHLAFTTLLVPTVLALRHQIAKAFTNDADVIAGAAKVFVPLAFSMIGDSANSALAAAVRGSGRQHLGAVICICSWWVYGFPMMCTFAFALNLGTVGMWLGLMIAANSQTLVLVYLVFFRIDWVREARRAMALAAVAAAAEGDAKPAEMANGLESDRLRLLPGTGPSDTNGRLAHPLKGDGCSIPTFVQMGSVDRAGVCGADVALSVHAGRVPLVQRGESAGPPVGPAGSTYHSPPRENYPDGFPGALSGRESDPLPVSDPGMRETEESPAGGWERAKASLGRLGRFSGGPAPCDRESAESRSRSQSTDSAKESRPS